MISAALALSASLAWGCSDFLGGLTSRRLPTVTVLFLSQCVALALFNVVFLLTGPDITGDVHFLSYAVLSGLGEAIGLGAFYRGLAVGAMGVVSPIAAGAAVIPVAFGLAAGESPDTVEAIGIPMALTGVILVAWEPRGVERSVPIAAGVGLACVAALGFGGFFIAIDAAAERGDVLSAVFVNRVALVVMVGLAFIALRPSMPEGLVPAISLVAIGILDIAGSTLFAAASTQGLLVIVGTLGALYPILTVILARMVLKERLGGLQRAGTAIGLTGIAMISAGI